MSTSTHIGAYFGIFFVGILHKALWTQRSTERPIVLPPSPPLLLTPLRPHSGITAMKPHYFTRIMDDGMDCDPPLPSIYATPPTHVSVLRGFMRFVPPIIKHSMYRTLRALGWRWGWSEGHSDSIYHLPFGLSLHVADTTNGPRLFSNEVASLQYLALSNIHGINFPHIVDFTVDTGRGLSYMLLTDIDGDPLAPTLDHFSDEDWERLATDLQLQLRSLRLQTSSKHPICNADGAIINDPRIAWVAEHSKSVSTIQQFFSQVWLDLHHPWNDTTVQPNLRPLINRRVPVTICHGEVCPRNIILLGGLSAWRAGKTRLCFVNWECSGWMPAPWEALKATFWEGDPSTKWFKTIRKTLPEFDEYLDADWEWRSKFRMTGENRG